MPTSRRSDGSARRPTRERDDWRTYYPLYLEVKRLVSGTPWFVADGWACDTDLWATQCHFALYKDHWRHHGICLESWFGNHEAGKRHTKVALLVPEDMTERDQFVATFHAHAAEVVKGLVKYRTDAGFHPVFRKLPVDRDTLVPKLLAELDAVHVLGNSVDAALGVV